MEQHDMESKQEGWICAVAGCYMRVSTSESRSRDPYDISPQSSASDQTSFAGPVIFYLMKSEPTISGSRDSYGEFRWTKLNSQNFGLKTTIEGHAIVVYNLGDSPQLDYSTYKSIALFPDDWPTMANGYTL